MLAMGSKDSRPAEDLDGAVPPWVCTSESGKLYAKEIEERALALTNVRHRSWMP